MVKKSATETGSPDNTIKAAIVVLMLGCVLLALHHWLLSTQSISSDENWAISIETTWQTPQPGSLIIQPPYETQHIRLHSRAIEHKGLRISPTLRSNLNKRALNFKARQAGSYQVMLGYELQFSPAPHFHPASNGKLSTLMRQYYLSDPDNQLGLENSRLDDVLSSMGDLDNEGLLAAIFRLSKKLVGTDSENVRTAGEILKSGKANARERALLMTALSRKIGLPARVVSGIVLKDDPSAKPVFWTEVFVDDSWVPYNPASGYEKELPPDHIALDRFGDGIVSAKYMTEDAGQGKLEYEILIERIPASIANPDSTRRVWYQVFMLDRLPSEVREELALLMLLPLGALLTCVIRQLGGIHSYGVFTPTILALAMVYVDWQITMLILLIIIAMAFLGRPTFNPNMSRTPRLSIIFTLVAISMVLGVSVLDYFDMASDSHLILLPIVILTSLIDRFFSTVERVGYHTAVIRLIWTIIITLVTLPIFSLLWLGALLLRYPEAHLFTLSAFILISTYTFQQRRLPGWLGVLSEPAVKKKNEFDIE